MGLAISSSCRPWWSLVYLLNTEPSVVGRVQAWIPSSPRSNNVRGITPISSKRFRIADGERRFSPPYLASPRRNKKKRASSTSIFGGDDGRNNNGEKSPKSRQDPVSPSRLTETIADAMRTAWSDEECAEQLPTTTTMSLKERMKMAGAYLGESGRQLTIECSQTTTTRSKIRNKNTTAFFKDFVEYTKVLCNDDADAAIKTPSADGFNNTNPPTKVQEKSLQDQCIEWYKQQPGALEEPPEIVTKLFSQNLDFMQIQPTNILDVVFFNDAVLAQNFIKFIKSVASREDARRDAVQLLAIETVTAFRSEYVDSRGVVDDFIGYVDDCHAEYQRNTEKYESPYISLCQSSGYGKSRLLQQVAERRKLLYVGVGNSKQSYPGRNVREFLFLDDHHNCDVLQREKHLQQQLERCVSWCFQHDFSDVDQFGATPAFFWDDIAHHPTTDFDSSWKQNDPVWMAFDEARSLLVEPNGKISDFQILRWALRAVSEKMGHQIFVILVDTKSTISSYSPSTHPNLDKYYATERCLFHPYLLLFTQDTFMNDEVDFTDEWSFVDCGRPLWKARYPTPSTSAGDLFTYASNKLRLSTRANFNDEMALLAISISRTGVYINPQSSTASDLAANYMGTLLLSDCAHEHFLVTYLSDPVLTIASATLWYTDNLLEKYGLPLLRRKLLHGAVREGFSGELVGRMLLLIGMDKTTKGGAYDGKWCKVSAFMESCFGITDCMVGEEAYMGFSHFIPYAHLSHFIPYAQEPKTYQDLKDLMYRRGACCLPFGFEGVDLLIPFWRKTDKGPAVSYILIRIKNNIASEKNINGRDKMNPSTCFAKGSELRGPTEDIILIIMQIGLKYKARPPVPKRVGNVQGDHWKKWVYSVRGITSNSFPFLRGQERLMEELVRLAKGSLNVQEWMSCDEVLNQPPTSPGMSRRRDHIKKIVP